MLRKYTLSSIILLVLLVVLGTTSVFGDCQIAVAPFEVEGLSGQYIQLGKTSSTYEVEKVARAVTDRITHKLGSAKQIALVEREKLQKVTNELELAQSGLVSTSSAAKVGKMIGADYMLLGTVNSISVQLVRSVNILSMLLINTYKIVIDLYGRLVGIESAIVETTCSSHIDKSVQAIYFRFGNLLSFGKRGISKDTINNTLDSATAKLVNHLKLPESAKG